MNAFYAMVKSLDEHLAFVFITGVPKLSKVSVFSGMNNLEDISMDKHFSALCGYTESELQQCFSSSIKGLASEEGENFNAVSAKIKQWYSGYLFHPLGVGVYNPHSILCLLKSSEFKNYWFQSATPTFLIDLLKAKDYKLSQLESLRVSQEGFESSEPENMSVQALLFQTGYLTIRSWTGTLYILDFPNKEVRDSFYGAIVEQYAYVDKGIGPVYIEDLQTALQNNDLDMMFDTLELFFANISYDIAIQQEKYSSPYFLLFLRCWALLLTSK